jgi:hypothetical protein
MRRFLVTASVVLSSPILVTLMKEELSASIIRVTIGELGTMLAVTSNRRGISSQRASVAKFLRNVGSYKSHTA